MSKRAFLGPQIFLFPEKGQSSSWQNNKQRTLVVTDLKRRPAKHNFFFFPQKKRNEPNRELPIINYGTETIKVVLLLFLRIYEINGGSKIASTGRYRPQESLQGTPKQEFGILLCATFAFKIPPSGVHSLASLC